MQEVGLLVHRVEDGKNCHHCNVEVADRGGCTPLDRHHHLHHFLDTDVDSTDLDCFPVDHLLFPRTDCNHRGRRVFRRRCYLRAVVLQKKKKILRVH